MIKRVFQTIVVFLMFVSTVHVSFADDDVDEIYGVGTQSATILNDAIKRAGEQMPKNPFRPAKMGIKNVTEFNDNVIANDEDISPGLNQTLPEPPANYPVLQDDAALTQYEKNLEPEPQEAIEESSRTILRDWRKYVPVVKNPLAKKRSPSGISGLDD